MSPTQLPLFPCHFIEIPQSGIDCSITNSTICVECKIAGRFISGAVTDTGSYGAGHIVSILLWALTLLFGIFGMIANIFIIAVVLRRKTGKSFDLLLLALAGLDFVGSLTSIMATTATISLLENWDRGITSNYFVFFGVLTCFFARSASSFMTMMITLERYLIIAFPIRFSNWFTPVKTKLIIAGVYLFSAGNSLPRFTSFQVVKNDWGEDIPSLRSFGYIMVSTPLQKFWYGTLRGYFSKIDYWVPLPCLLILNILLFIEIKRFQRKRNAIMKAGIGNVTHPGNNLKQHKKQEKEIRAVKMFVPVVVVLFLCNIVPYVFYFLLVKDGIVYRELFVGVFLSVAINSSVNLPIYYARGSSFRSEINEILSKTRFYHMLGIDIFANHEMPTESVELSTKKSSEPNDAVKPDHAFA